MSWAGKNSFKDSLRGLFSKKEQASSFSVSKSPQILPQTVERMDKMIQTWIRGKGYRMPDKTIEQAAVRIGTDSATLYRYFKSRGEDFRSFRSRLRLEDAMQQMLDEPATPASTIGKRVGFNDRANFAHQFKAYTGFTPDQWRREQQSRADSK